MLSTSIMPEAYLISYATVEAEIIPAVHHSLVASSPARAAEQVLSEALTQAELPSTHGFVGYWGGSLPENTGVYPYIQVAYLGASSMQALFCASQAIQAGDGELYYAGGAGLSATRTQRKRIYRQLGLHLEVDSHFEPLQGAGALVLASTDGVGINNLSPKARIAARARSPLIPGNSQQSLKAVLATLFRRSGFRPEDINACFCDSICEKLHPGWYEELGMGSGTGAAELDVSSTQTGEAQGVLMIVQVLEALQKKNGTLGLALQAAWDGTFLGCLLERV